MFQLIIVDEKVWSKDVGKIPPHVFAKIKGKILELSHFPEKGDLKKLNNFPTADYRLRIGKYRVLFDVDTKQEKVLLYRILHRKDSYRL